MIKTTEYINNMTNKINLKSQELRYEKDGKRRQQLQRELEVLRLKKEIGMIRKKIQQLEMY